jgi:hypothetical protein
MKNRNSTTAKNDIDPIKPVLSEKESITNPGKGLFRAACWARNSLLCNAALGPRAARSIRGILGFSGRRRITVQAIAAALLASLVLALTITDASAWPVPPPRSVERLAGRAGHRNDLQFGPISDRFRVLCRRSRPIF